MPDKPTRKQLPAGTALHVRDTCLCLHAQRAARALARRFDAAFKPLGLTNGQFSLLMSLNQPQPLRMGDVADLLGMDRTTLTAALKSLERRDLVHVLPDPQDRRSRRLSLSDDGLALLGEAVKVWEGEHSQLEASLDDVDAASLRAGLRTLEG